MKLNSKLWLFLIVVLFSFYLVSGQEYYDGNWSTYGDYTEYVGIDNILKVEYSLKGIEQILKGENCGSNNATLQDMYGEDIAFCFNVNNSCVYDCMWVDKNITSKRINLVYHQVFITPEEAIYWVEIEFENDVMCNWWCKILRFFHYFERFLK